MQYMDSKNRIAKHIVPIIQKYIDDNDVKKYIEPFVGGANVIDKVVCEERYGSDKNKYLIALLQRVRDGGSLYDEVSKDLYDKARTAFNKGDTSEFADWEIGNIGFIASYNGRWFDGGYAKTGYEKTKYGMRLRNYYQEARKNILQQAPNLKGIVFRELDYTDAIIAADYGLVIYCDPPYKGKKGYANAVKFNYEEFWQTMRVWSKNNIVLISEDNAPDDFVCIWQQEVTRSIHACKREKATEKLYIHKSKVCGGR